MTNRELIEYLQDLPLDMHVRVFVGGEEIGMVGIVLNAFYWWQNSTIDLWAVGKGGTMRPDPDPSVPADMVTNPRWKYTNPEKYWRGKRRQMPEGWETVIDPPDGSRAGKPPDE